MVESSKDQSGEFAGGIKFLKKAGVIARNDFCDAAISVLQSLLTAGRRVILSHKAGLASQCQDFSVAC